MSLIARLLLGPVVTAVAEVEDLRAQFLAATAVPDILRDPILIDALLDRRNDLLKQSVGIVRPGGAT